MQNRVYLVRHGENPANLTKEFSHRRVDYPLTSKGREQALQTAHFFRDKEIHAIYSSPLKRATETAQIIADRSGLDFTIVEEFREINVGILENLPTSAANWQIHDRIILGWLNGKPMESFPGGEDYGALCQRMQAGLAAALDKRQNQNIILVGHGGIFTLTLKDLCPGIDIFQILQQENHNCSISELIAERKGEKIQAEVLQWASVSHLSGIAADLISGRLEP